MGFDVKRLDIYRKVPKDLTQPTVSGAIISVCCCSFMFLLLVSELWNFISPDIVSDLLVDNPGNQSGRIAVHLEISLPRLQCQYVGLDIQDDQGRHEVGMVENTKKTPVLSGAGCLMVADFQINKVPGNFHVSTHSSRQKPAEADFAHVVHELRFGRRVSADRLPMASFSPLSERHALDSPASASHDYIMKVVPTVYVDLSGVELVSYQYTYVSRARSQLGRAPAIWFKYDLNPITVRYHERRPPVYTFITTVCAIVGGTFTVAGIVDSAVFTASEMFKKFELGKLT
ncbi:LOW QUALITY PROTEIN: endoplasmic reticulum-Golgi intermediate compartment protein 1-like [Pollicipes pollicipes]|uniref:endoplasmic reticulum-Golgi intermediate compartment protein 1-like n=1 Tax=Pollicipes pollicipes TaxID=41117 RepID=UPI0018854012|nr:endoplasmic reticulum-Golgi intermediate compartment protein 1-like [Pollicipes pollicipes]XP_037069073.1 LOW QUALITY PROTEIN: endoplasmic reticulum-Golgi intermediate compartment protein 1-like [Pollicipes pollicipes]